MTSTVLELFEFDLRWTAVLRRFGWAASGFLVLRAKGLVTLPLALWILGAKGYGEVTVATAAAPAVVAILLLNVPDGAGRLVIGAGSADAAARRVSAIRRAGIGAAAVLLAGAAVGFGAGWPVAGWALLVAAGASVLKVGAVHLEYFQRTSLLVRFQVVAEYTGAAAGLAVAAWLGAGGMLAAMAIVSAAAGVFAWRTLRAPAAAVEDDSFWRPALRLSLPLLPVSLAQWALFSVDALLVYAIVGQAATGAYSAAYSIASVALLLPLGINAVWAPTAQRLLAASRVELRRFTRRAFQIVTAVSVVVALVALVGAPLLTHVLHASVYGPVPRCIFWIVVGFAALAFCKLSEGIVYAAGRPVPILLAYCAGAAANLGLNLLWIPSHGILGAAWATAAGYAATAVLLALPAVKELRRVEA